MAWKTHPSRASNPQGMINRASSGSCEKLLSCQRCRLWVNGELCPHRQDFVKKSKALQSPVQAGRRAAKGKLGGPPLPLARTAELPKAKGRVVNFSGIQFISVLLGFLASFVTWRHFLGKELLA